MKQFTQEEIANAINTGICPQCESSIIYPRGDTPYCEDCGWPDDDFGEESMDNISIEDL
jgi:hypothetical protein